MILIIVALMAAANPGVIIVDNVWFYGNDHKMRILHTGDIVNIIEEYVDKYAVEYDTAYGELEKNVLVDLSSDIAVDELFVFARGDFDNGHYAPASRLLEIFVEYYKYSPYAAEALYFLGQSMEIIAADDTSRTLQSVMRNERLNQNFYNGDAYHVIVEEYGESIYAPKAQYRLINIFRMEHLPWDDSVAVVAEELSMWNDFCERYAETDEYVLGLAESGYLNRVLYEITADDKYRDQATSSFSEILAASPATVLGAYARVNLHELTTGKKIYKY